MVFTDISIPEDLKTFITEKIVDDDRHDKPNIHYWFVFNNGLGASLVKHPYTYGAYRDEWELAIMDVVDDVCTTVNYDYDITNNDVLGYLSDEEAIGKLREIQKL